jgi:5-methyltetrahydropteroyltriglutamate--homocysteine methyltransferase
MVIASNLGFPRIGARRELKRALERFWAGKISEADLLETGRSLREAHWRLQHRLGIQQVPSNDFSLYDQVLDTAVMVGAVPSRYGWRGDQVDTATYFSMARGRVGEGGVRAMEMTKWFDTNYHYLVPEFEPAQAFRLASLKPLAELDEARTLGIPTRPVLLGPVSFLLLGKSRGDERQLLPALLSGLLPVYEDLLGRLGSAGAEWVQLDEPFLVLDLEPEHLQAFRSAYERLAAASPRLKILLATYFGDLRGNLSTALQLPVSALHLDLCRAPEQLREVLPRLPERLSLSLGLVDGRNIWRNELARSIELATSALQQLGPDRLMVAPSCSLLHVPFDLEQETELDPELRSWMAFARQKLEEVSLLSRALSDSPEAVREALAANQAAWASRRASPRTSAAPVRQRLAQVDSAMLERRSPFARRRDRQHEQLRLPRFPTTTIGSFPQTGDVRQLRADLAKGKLSEEGYRTEIRREIERTIRFQEEADLDVLVHGEFERTDMVEYFGEQLPGYCSTSNGWVQSYGSRCVKPPVIYGDVSRPSPMTLEWWRYAQSLTARPVKGMLTGPVTMMQWSFVRDDQPRRDTCFQIALAVRDEVADLETAGCRVIQIDEPAFREGLPLRRADWPEYLSWAVDAFRLSSSGVSDATQIHTHMCYAEFNDIIEFIAALDADVISIEASRSGMELLEAFGRFHYPNQIGPGVWDIHSPRVPSAQEMIELMRKALAVLSPEQLWVNPDCGLKTRRWEEVRPALLAMTTAARALRE